jgi:hypothetical protein
MTRPPTFADLMFDPGELDVSCLVLQLSFSFPSWSAVAISHLKA